MTCDGWNLNNHTDSNGMQYTTAQRTHWDGCEAVHPECKIAQLEAENSALRAIITAQESDLSSVNDELIVINRKLAALSDNYRVINSIRANQADEMLRLYERVHELEDGK